MNITRINQIVCDTTQVFRKGELVTLNGTVVEVFNYPPVADASGVLKLIDVHFVQVGVRLDTASRLKAELIALLSEYPRFAKGPSYIEIGAELGDQEAALRLFALGEVLGLWEVITPATLGMTGTAADELAGTGFIMTNGFAPMAVVIPNG